MPLSINSLKKDERPLTVPYGKEEVNIVYRPSEWTPAVEEQWTDTEGSGTHEMLEFLNKIIVSWDIYEDDKQEKPLPKELDSFYIIPTPLSLAFLREIQEDAVPGKEKRTSSSGRSKRRN